MDNQSDKVSFRADVRRQLIKYGKERYIKQKIYGHAYAFMYIAIKPTDKQTKDL